MEGSMKIRKAIEAKEAKEANKSGLLIGRFGTIEFDVIWASKNGSVKSDMLATLEKNAGVFGNRDQINSWIIQYTEAIAAADILATGWYQPIRLREQKFLEGFTGIQVPLRSLEPYYWPADAQWSTIIKGKVCVVSSFANTIMSQVKKDIFPGMWSPDIEWSAVRTGYAPSLALGRASWPGDVESWEDCVKGVVDDVLAIDPRVVIIGCGGLGMIIGSRLKANRICIVLGGATQVLFGIKGQRWASHDVISKFWGPDWVWPDASETPGGASEVERGCYWGLNKTL
jgi:hypothetical protein